MDRGFTVVGIEEDSEDLIFKDNETGDEYTTGENLDDFGIENLTSEEIEALGLRLNLVRGKGRVYAGLEDHRAFTYEDRKADCIIWVRCDGIVFEGEWSDRPIRLDEVDHLIETLQKAKEDLKIVRNPVLMDKEWGEDNE